MLAEHDEVEQMVTVYLPATYAAIKAFNRFVLIEFLVISLYSIPQTFNRLVLIELLVISRLLRG